MEKGLADEKKDHHLQLFFNARNKNLIEECKCNII